MKIQGNPSHISHAYDQIKRQVKTQGVQENTNKSSGKVNTENLSQPSTSVELNTGDAKGVIQHLQEGHYQGVAQLRLSIVHAERFQQATVLETAKILEEKGEMLTDELKNVLTSLISPLDTNEDAEPLTDAPAPLDVEHAMNIFEEALASGKSELEDTQPSVETFSNLYSKAFLALVDYLEPLKQQVNDMVEANQSPPATDGEDYIIADKVPVDKSVQPHLEDTNPLGEQSGMNIDLDEMKAKFNILLESSLQSVEIQIATISAPPLPTQPNGNGVSYDKFLAAYEEIYIATEQQSNTTNPEETTFIENEV